MGGLVHDVSPEKAHVDQTLLLFIMGNSRSAVTAERWVFGP